MRSHAHVPDSPTTRRTTIEFSSNAERLYRIMTSSDLKTFTDSGLGTFSPSAGSTTTRSFSRPSATRFFRVVAVKPLQP